MSPEPSQVLRDTVAMMYWCDPVFLYAGSRAVLFRPQCVAETAEKVGVDWALGYKMDMIVVAVAAFVRETPTFHTTALFRRFSVNDPIQMVPKVTDDLVCFLPTDNAYWLEFKSSKHIPIS
jgi:hypothetical protein